MRHRALLNSVTTFARAMPQATVEELGQALDGLPDQAGAEQRLAAARRVTEPNARQAARALLAGWVAHEPSVTPASLALALRSASVVDELARKEQRLELVWTGPSTEGMRLRRSEQALLELINAAQSSLLLVIYVAYDIGEVVEALEQAIQRAVELTLVIETPEASGGKLTMAATQALMRVVQAGAKVLYWPPDKRQHDSDGHHGLLHVKCCVADERQALISSANLTGHALNLNMELGVLISGGRIPRELAEHFRRLISEKVLVDLAIG